MLDNSCSEKTLLIPTPTTNPWPQNHHHHEIDHDQKDLLMTASKASIKQMDQKPQQQQQQQPALKCPRCDSSNTKFCYYNNYSLSQPRHFCKACKRYWTRGGTLRNVPVGGGCRKNRRVRRPSSSSSLDPPANPPSHTDGSASSNGINPLFYGLAGSLTSEINLSVPSFTNSHALSGYDHLHQSQFSALGLGFSAPNSEISDSLLSSYGLFGSSSSNGLQQQRILSMSGLRESRGDENHHFQSFVPFEGNISGARGARVEQARDLQMEWNNGHVPNNCQNQMERAGGEPHPTLYWNNNATAAACGWSDLPKPY